ncbi:hypothetical protein FDP41_013251 [Naegleria fowleri]|uniref:deoxyribose-phosphate aldolase n=1 Tax=Naegleria fowleri TaxID=5763 RepID=A0A6A5C4H2_NAEFO|nr:uncharacterized protein FDP41_013251 [Naegleria fowleri]KAF0980768.1 hypothetical protein FDP41_013251 [Naegleria fowleri]CAG4719192.1 unnamed protein product [Naegleria fowleri]
MSCCSNAQSSSLSGLLFFGGLTLATVWMGRKRDVNKQQQESDNTTIESFIPFVRERVEIVAGKLGIPSKDIYQMLPHLSKETTETKFEKSNLPLSQFIDHTILKANAKMSEVEQLCKEALTNNFAAVCVNASNVALCKKLLEGSNVKIASVVGFPLGATTVESKIFETRQVIDLGAHEIDMVINVGRLLDGDYQYIYDELKRMADACIEKGAVLKVILECCLLNKDLIADASIMCMLAKCHYVKTSTGFSTSGAKLEDCKLMKAVVGNVGLVKAAGGIRDKETALKFIEEAKISRIGTSSGAAIIGGMKATGY